MGERVIEDPLRRQRTTFQDPDEHGVVRAEVVVQPGGDVPPHVHPLQDERFEVLEGKARFTVGRKRVHLGPGEDVMIPAGTRHAFKNTSATPTRLLVEVDQGMRLEPFLTEAAALARAGKYTRRGIPTSFDALLQLSVVAWHHRETTLLLNPPPFLQPILLKPLARLGARRGYRPGSFGPAA